MVMQEDKENKPTSLHLAKDIHSLRALHLTFSLSARAHHVVLCSDMFGRHHLCEHKRERQAH